MAEQDAERMVIRVVALLRQRREELELSQRALAARAGLDAKTVNLIERGARSPTLFTIALLAAALEIPLWEVMREAEPDPDVPSR